MIKVINKETKVIKELKSEDTVAMYIATGEWELYKDLKDYKKSEKPVFSKKEEE